MNQPYCNTQSLNSQFIEAPFLNPCGVLQSSEVFFASDDAETALPHIGERAEAGSTEHRAAKPADSRVALLNLINSSQREKKSRGTEKSYSAKIVISGNIVQLYEYEKAKISTVRAGRKKEKKQGAQVAGEGAIRTGNVFRAITQCKRLINCNAGRYQFPDKFVTLTFKENETDLDSANHQFKLFMKRLEYRLGIDVEYVAVPQIQWKRFEKTGHKVWHYHVLFFGLDYVKNSQLREIWGLGFVRINAVDRIDDIGSYVSRYMEKDFDRALVKNHRRYLTSSGLHRPIEIRVGSIEDLPAIAEDCKSFEVEYKNNESIGWVKFKQYKFGKPPCVNKFSLQEQEGKLSSESQWPLQGE